jgi:hypothetical protein
MTVVMAHARASVRLAAVSSQLSFSDHVHRLATGRQDPRAAERFEAQHRSGDAFDRTMILLDDVGLSRLQLTNSTP